MKVLVIGGTGFLSSAVVQELLAAGHQVSIFTRGQSKKQPPAEVKFIKGDRKNRTAFFSALSALQFDAVIDCICYTPEDARSDIETFAGKVKQLLFISTDFVYGGEPRRLPLEEDSPTVALNEYGRNKRRCEELFLQAWQTAQSPVTIFRPPHIMGAGGLLGTGSLYGRDKNLLNTIRKEKPVVLLDDGMLLIQPVVHTDIGRACVAALGKEQTFGQVYNLAGTDIITTRKYYEFIGEALDSEVKILSLPSSIYIAVYPDRAPFAAHRVYDTSKLLRDTGFSPSESVRDAIFAMVEWLDKNPQAQVPQTRPLDAALNKAFEEHAAHLQKLLRGHP